MHTIHFTRMAFFSSFFVAWFSCAVLMPAVEAGFAFSADQVANFNIAATVAAVTVLAALFVAALGDRHHSRKSNFSPLMNGVGSVHQWSMAQR